MTHVPRRASCPNKACLSEELVSPDSSGGEFAALSLLPKVPPCWPELDDSFCACTAVLLRRYDCPCSFALHSKRNRSDAEGQPEG